MLDQQSDDYYLTITESKRDFNEDGTPFYKKHKIYLYKEDFQNFKDHLNEMVEYIIKREEKKLYLYIKMKILQNQNKKKQKKNPQLISQK